jgi:hypothetical protein
MTVRPRIYAGEKQKTTWSMADFFSCSAKARRHIRSAVVMSLAYCYHSRLPREQRMLLRHAITDAWEAMQVPARNTAFGWYIPGKDFCTWLCLGAGDIATVIESVQKTFVEKMCAPSPRTFRSLATMQKQKDPPPPPPPLPLLG